MRYFMFTRQNVVSLCEVINGCFLKDDMVRRKNFLGKSRLKKMRTWQKTEVKTESALKNIIKKDDICEKNEEGKCAIHGMVSTLGGGVHREDVISR